jgi:hypothetical protein
MTLWDSYQDIRTKHVAESIIHRDAKLRDLRECVSQLEGEFNSNFDKLTLLCRAMWSLIEENTDLTEEDLESKILELELLEGKLFEESEETVESCPSCNAAIPADMDRCQFCGHEL